MEEKKSRPARTIDLLKKEREVPQQVKEELKQYNRMKRAIRKALEDGPLTIPELAAKLDINKSDATYYLMSLRKYGFVTTGELDDMDEYYSYQLKK
ncbi:ArsR family transcriptional regulator [Bacteroidota bacterium]